MTSSIILASASPRRAELLRQIQVSFEVMAVDIDESHRPGETPQEFARRLAYEKAVTAQSRITTTQQPVLGSDTIVVIEEHIMGKPTDYQSAADMLARLSAQTHQVMTAVSVVQGERHEEMLSISQVRFRQLTDEEIVAYWRTGEPHDKAGSYAIQGIAAQFIQHIEGSFSGVMGLPLYETALLLNRFGITTL